ncbi:ATP-binding cassette domain-containing protein, partial [Streptococcus pyogenes]
AARVLNLTNYLERRPGQLSGGQRQRVALARSVAKRPKVLLLDEPLGALDKKLREETQFELMDLQQELGLTFVVVTHDQEEAMTMADRIAIMDKGEVMQVATPAEVYEAPASRFVANFVGNVNMFEGKVAERTKDLGAALEGLRRSTAVMETTFRSMAEAVLVIDGTGTVLLSNPAAEKMLRYKPGMTVRQLRAQSNVFQA